MKICTIKLSKWVQILFCTAVFIAFLCSLSLLRSLILQIHQTCKRTLWKPHIKATTKWLRCCYLLRKLWIPREFAEVHELQMQRAVLCQDAAATRRPRPVSTDTAEQTRDKEDTTQSVNTTQWQKDAELQPVCKRKCFDYFIFWPHAETPNSCTFTWILANINEWFVSIKTQEALWKKPIHLHTEQPAYIDTKLS